MDDGAGPKEGSDGEDRAASDASGDSPVGTDLAPEKPSAAPEDAPQGSTPTQTEASEAPREPLSPALIGACVALWVLAMIVFAMQIPAMRVDYHLGDLHLGLAERNPTMIRAATDALVAQGESVLDTVADELSAPDKQGNIPYRLTLMVEVVGRIKGKAATELLTKHLADPNPATRTNVYTVLAERARDGLSEDKAGVEATLRKATQSEPDPVARAYAARALLLLLGEGAPDLSAIWVIIKTLRSIPPDPRLAGLAPPLLSCLQVGMGKDLPYELAQPLKQRDQQIAAFEEAYVALGGKIPTGEDLASYRKATPIQAPPASTAPTTSETKPNPTHPPNAPRSP